MAGEATITIPGTQTKVPKWAPLAAVGVIAAILLLKPKASDQGDFNEEGTAEEEGAGVGSFEDLLNELLGSQGLEAPGEPMQIGYSAASPNQPVGVTTPTYQGKTPGSNTGFASGQAPPGSTFQITRDYVSPYPVHQGGELSTAGKFITVVKSPITSPVQLAPSGTINKSITTTKTAASIPQHYAAAGGAVKSPITSSVKLAPTGIIDKSATTTKTATTTKSAAKYATKTATTTKSAAKYGGGANSPPSLPDWLWKLLRTPAGRTATVAVQRDVENWNRSPLATAARRSIINPVNRAFSNEASVRRQRVITSGIVSGGERISQALGGWPYNRKP